MAQANPANDERRAGDVTQKDDHHMIKNGASSSSTATTAFKFNAHAAEFIPRSHTTNTNTNNQMAISGYFYPYLQFTSSTDPWFYLNSNNNQEQYPSFPLLPNSLPNNSSPRNHVLTDDLHHKIIKQVEYLFSDLSLMANDTMAKHLSKDPEGYVPIPVIASMKKIKALATDHHLLVQALRSSTKLVVSKDSKKVKRRSPFTENDKDELQCRTVMVENLPEDHSYQNLEKIFSVVGSVKAIRLCHPPEANPCRSKNEVIISNKLHALVEYENAEIAERAAERLNDERNWRKGMRVRVMLRRTPKSVLKGRKSEFDTLTDDEDQVSAAEQVNNAADHFVADNNNLLVEDQNSGGSRKGSVALVRGRGKSKGRMQQQQCHSGRGLLASPTAGACVGSGSPSPALGLGLQLLQSCDTPTKQIMNSSSSRGPRMPDGTRGFTLGRGKPFLSCS